MLLYIIAIFYGVLIGNYITTAYFRIPRFIPINGLNNKTGKVPHCSVCKHKLKFYEYLPVLSWISTRFKCNYCLAPITYIYVILEVSVMLASVVLYYLLGMNMLYMISVLVTAGLVLNLSLFFTYYKFYSKALYIALVAALMMVFYFKNLWLAE